MSKSIRCPQCELVAINGIPCHETGCPLSHIDPRTDQPYPVECFECGCEYVPEGRTHRTSICSDCANPEPIDEDDSSMDRAYGKRSF